MNRLNRIVALGAVAAAAFTVPALSVSADGFDTATLPASGTTTSHTVVAGEGLFQIANHYGVSLDALLAANGLSATSVIVPGQQLIIPPEGSTVSGGSAPGTIGYTVRDGDTLFGIANRHAVPLEALLSANGLTLDSVIIAGDRLVVPIAAAVVAPAASSSDSSQQQRTPKPAASGHTHTVSPGDTLFSIANHYGVSLDGLMALNGLNASSLITPGMTLQLPVGAEISKVDIVLDYAIAQLGKPYVFFTKGPNTFDCSGLTLAAYAQVGINLIHHAESQSRVGTPVDWYSEAIQAGDLVFLSTDGSGTINHVGIALDNNRFLQARRPGVPVMVSEMPSDGAILAVRRLL